MKADHWSRVREVFHAVIEHPEAEWPSRLDELCAGDVDLRSAVEKLLASHHPDSVFLDPPRERSAEQLLDDYAGGDVGRRIGPYRLTGLIGTGGMGRVYRGVRSDDEYEQVVAVKLLKRELASEQLLRGFRHERQTLAGLDHPNIARLLDGGTADDGSPYLVMEYVDGKAIDTWCDDRAAPIADRLRLVRRVCDTVMYAHRNLVVHRDLKPGNILVTDDGQPKLLDFGIAKLLKREEAAGEAGTTVSSLRIMTPQYASPEQIRGETITTASDVYSLGVITYELLTGHSPYTGINGNKQVVERQVCEEEPERPSTVVGQERTRTRPDGSSQVVTPVWVSRVRQCNPDQLRRRLRGDLDTIVLTALQKDPARRYTTVDQYSEDLQRFLDGLPIRARGDSVLYRTGKFIRRNKVAVAACVVAVLALIGGTIGTTVGMLRAEAEAENARTEAEKAEDVTTFLRTMLVAVAPYQNGPDVTVRTVLDETARRVDREFDGRPEVEAAVRYALGSAYSSLAMYEEAEHHLQRALEIRVSLSGEDHEAVAESRIALGWVFKKTGRYQEAEALLRSALEIQRRAAADDPKELAATMRSYGLVLLDTRDVSAAEDILQEALQIEQEHEEDNPAGISQTLQHLAALRIQAGRYADAEPLLRQSLSILRQVYGDDHVHVATCRNDLARALRNQGKYDEAEAEYRETIRSHRQGGLADHPLTGVVLSNLGTLLTLKGELVEAETVLREAIAVLQKSLGENHPDVIQAINHLAKVLADKHEWDAAEELYRESLERRRDALGPDHPDLAESLNDLALFCARTGRVEQAIPLYREALAIWKQALGPTHPHTAICMDNLGVSLMRIGEYEESDAMLRAALDARRETLGPSHIHIALSLDHLAHLCRVTDRYAEAEQFAEELVAMSAKVFHADHPRVAAARFASAKAQIAQAKYELAHTNFEEALRILRLEPEKNAIEIGRYQSIFGERLTSAGRYEEAEPLVLEGFEVLAPGDRGAKFSRPALLRIIALYEAWGKPEQAAEWRARLATLDKEHEDAAKSGDAHADTE